MGSTSHHVCPPVRKRFCDQPTPFLDVRKIEVAPQHERRYADLAEAAKGRCGIKRGLHRRSAQHGTVHVEEQLPGRTCDASVFGQGAVEPQPSLDHVHPVQIAGVLGARLLLKHLSNVRRVDRRGRAIDVGGDEDQPGDACGVPERGVDGDFPPNEQPTRIAI